MVPKIAKVPQKNPWFLGAVDMMGEKGPPFGSRVGVKDFVSARLAEKGPGRGPCAEGWWRNKATRFGGSGIVWRHHRNNFWGCPPNGLKWLI